MVAITRKGTAKYIQALHIVDAALRESSFLHWGSAHARRCHYTQVHEVLRLFGLTAGMRVGCVRKVLLLIYISIITVHGQRSMVSVQR